ncbi:hypothetical protein FB45DRAFT_457177 [Roridomyces roridus]|uniref:Uncharacterized protein n=1 Tax=Roridomyces roridus TaxID=1738132 RepID=A0AAD7FSV7_9AGAR|nr:hypothetical protein FB45DRAFT_457177 [Roridomyces roridus]
MTEKAKTDPSDQILSSCITIGHIGKRLKMDLLLDDPCNQIGITVTNITVIRNVSPYAPVSGPFCTDPAGRLFGFKFNYKMFDGTWESHACLFGRSTVEAWLGLTPAIGTEPPHWLLMGTCNPDRGEVVRQSMDVYDPTNREGVALIGRRLFWSEIWPSGWIFQLADYNPGAGSVIGKKMQTQCDSGQMWKSFTGLFCNDPYSVAHTITSRVSGPRRIIPYEDGLLIKTDGQNFMVLLM